MDHAAPPRARAAAIGAELAGRPLPQPIDWEEFWRRDRRSEDWLCEPLLPRGRSVATYSAAKQGKSLLALDVSARLGTGRRALDQAPGTPVRVCYFDLEMTEDDVHERLSDLGYGPSEDLTALRYFLLPQLPPLDSEAGGATVRTIAAAHDADLVVIDTTSRVLRGAENDADTLRAYYRWTGAPLKADGRTVWRLDHAGKDLERGQRGTSAKADDVDVVWELTPREGGLRLRATHRRLGWVPEIVDLVRLDDPLRHERATESWPRGTRELAAAMDRLAIPADHGSTRVRSALRAAGHAARNDLVAAAIRYRRASGTASGTASTEGAGDRRGGQVGDIRADLGGPSPGTDGDTLPAADGDGGVSLVGDTPAPADPEEGLAALLAAFPDAELIEEE